MLDIAIRRLNINIYKISNWFKSVKPQKDTKITKKKLHKRIRMKDSGEVEQSTNDTDSRIEKSVKEKNELDTKNVDNGIKKEEQQHLDTSKLLKKKNNRYK